MVIVNLIVNIVEFLGIIFLALCSLTILKEMITLRADVETIRDLQSKEYAEKTAQLLVNEGYFVKSDKEVDTELAKKLLYENKA